MCGFGRNMLQVRLKHALKQNRGKASHSQLEAQVQHATCQHQHPAVLHRPPLAGIIAESHQGISIASGGSGLLGIIVTDFATDETLMAHYRDK